MLMIKVLMKLFVLD